MAQTHKTMAEIATELRAAPRPAGPAGRVKPGRVNEVGELFDPDGNLLSLIAGDVGTDQALRHRTGGTRVAFETCGCGGDYCEPVWLDPHRTSELSPSGPHLTKGDAPTWIDIWSGPAGEVVFLHGDLAWSPHCG